MSANFVQVSGPGGRTQTFVPGAATQTFIWNPASLKGTLPGGDFLYVSRARVRTTGFVTELPAGGNFQPNFEQMAQAFGQVRAYSPFLGEVVNKSLNSVPLLANHDMMFANGYRPITRARGQASGTTGVELPIEFEFEIPFERDYLLRSVDSCPWMPFFEGGTIEVDLRPSNALALFGFTMTGNWTQELVLDWYPDKQPLIHAPIASRLYRVTTAGPEYLLKSVGSPNGLDGVVAGARLAILSWLGAGASQIPNASDAGFYTAFSGGGLLFGTNGVNRLDVPFRDQVSIDAVSAWLGSFLADSNPQRVRESLSGIATAITRTQNDMAGWPYAQNPNVTNVSQSLINDGLNFWPLIWPGRFGKIADMQKVDGDLSFTASLTTPPANAILHLFRSDEVCGFTAAKVMDLMERMGLPHKSRGGAYDYIPKYESSKRADDTTQWGMPLKIVKAA